MSDRNAEKLSSSFQTRWTANELLAAEFPPVDFIVDGLITEGVTVLGGKPKTGKSFLALGLVMATAVGETALGSIECCQGDALYMALEDNPRRMNGRMRQLLGDEDKEIPGLDIWFETPRLSDGGIDQICKWVASKANPTLIIIDTFAKIRSVKAHRGSDYIDDYQSVTPLHDIARHAQLGFVLIHHTRKLDADDPLDTISGTTGFTGAADNILVLQRNAQGTTLYGRGRDIEEVEKAISFDPKTGHWTIMGEASDVRRSRTRRRILNVLHEEGRPLTPTEIAAKTELRDTTVRQTLRRMVFDSEVEKVERGLYRPLSLL